MSTPWTLNLQFKYFWVVFSELVGHTKKLLKVRFLKIVISQLLVRLLATRSSRGRTKTFPPSNNNNNAAGENSKGLKLLLFDEYIRTLLCLPCLFMQLGPCLSLSLAKTASPQPSHVSAPSWEATIPRTEGRVKLLPGFRLLW